MNRLISIVLVFAAGALGYTNASDISGDPEACIEEPPRPPRAEPCRVTGGGRIDWGTSPDSFGGNAQPFRSGVDGEWNHVTHEGEHFHGDPDFIECSIVAGDPAYPPAAPANAALFSGTGTFDGEEGCEFTVYVEDHGEPGTEDFYSIDITCPSGASYSAGDTLLDGNLQIHAVPPGHTPG